MNDLIAQGVEAGRFTIISYGKERPACTEKTEACRPGIGTIAS